MRAARHGEQEKRLRREIKARHFFKWKASLLKPRHPSVTAKFLARMWKAQRGRCALTGIKMDRTAQLDHVIPRALGGGSSLGNLRWLDGEVNRMRGAWMDVEFAVICDLLARRLAHWLPSDQREAA